MPCWCSPLHPHPTAGARVSQSQSGHTQHCGNSMVVVPEKGEGKNLQTQKSDGCSCVCLCACVLPLNIVGQSPVPILSVVGGGQGSFPPSSISTGNLTWYTLIWQAATRSWASPVITTGFFSGTLLGRNHITSWTLNYEVWKAWKQKILN